MVTVTTAEMVFYQALATELTRAGVIDVERVLRQAQEVGLTLAWSMEACLAWLELMGCQVPAADLQRALFVARARAGAHRENLARRAELAQALLREDRPKHHELFCLLSALIGSRDPRLANEGCPRTPDSAELQ